MVLVLVRDESEQFISLLQNTKTNANHNYEFAVCFQNMIYYFSHDSSGGLRGGAEWAEARGPTTFRAPQIYIFRKVFFDKKYF